MPLKVLCSRCGYVLYEGRRLKSLVGIVQSSYQICPHCMNRLKRYGWVKFEVSLLK